MRSSTLPRRFFGLLMAAPFQRVAMAAAIRTPALGGFLVATLRPSLALADRSGQRGIASSAVDLTAQIKETVGSSGVVLYSKSYCPFCLKTKVAFAELGVPTTVVELDEVDGGADIQDALAALTGQRTVPNVFVNGVHIGGNDDTQKAIKSGKVKEMLKL